MALKTKHSKLRTTILWFIQLLAALLMATASFFVPAHAAYTEDYGGAYGHWAYEAMAWAADSGVILNGSADRTDPYESLTRAEMAAMIARLYRTYQGTDVSRYTDLSPDTWYHDYIAQTVRMGAVTGYSSTRMGPDDLITREQAMTILARIICLPDGDSKALARFRDRDEIGPWARDTIAAMAANGYVKGYSDNCLYPKRTVTRAQMVQMMYNIFQNTCDCGTVTGTYSGNVLVRGDTDIHDAVIEGDLFLANGLRDRAITLKNVTVKGRLVVWGGSKVNITGSSRISAVVMPRFEAPVQVVFDETATSLSKAHCTVVRPAHMNPGNKVVFTDTAAAPTLSFTLPAYRYAGDTATVRTVLTGTDEVVWALTKDGAVMPVTDFTSDGGTLHFTQAGLYTLTGTARNSGGVSVCEKTVTVLPVGSIAFSLPESIYSDTPVAVSLQRKNGLVGKVTWKLTKDGEACPLPDGLTAAGGDLTLPEAGKYTLTATLTDAAGTAWQHSETITVLPVLVPELTVTPEELKQSESADISLTVQGGTPASVSWSMTRDGSEVSVSLSENGGTVCFTEAGSYELTVSVTDSDGRTFQTTAAFQVQEVFSGTIRLPAFSHTDETVVVGLESDLPDQSKVNWSLTVDGEPVSPVNGIRGSLSDKGGSVRFMIPGTNSLKAVMTDHQGRTVTCEKAIEVYPVLSPRLTADAAAHTDEAVSVSLSKEDTLPVTWHVGSDRGEADYTDALTDSGGSIRFRDAGSWGVTASVTDATGRTFTSNTAAVKVYPEAGLDFTLPGVTWTDKNCPVELLTSHLQGRDVTWTLEKDGAPVSLTGSTLGELGNLGGAVRFPEPGVYTLTASASDDLGRAYTSAHSIRVYPVAALHLSLAEMSHTDTAEDVTLTVEDLGRNKVAWTVLRDGEEIPAPFPLGRTGGHGIFDQPGRYSITASVTDEAGRVFSDTAAIQVYPVAVSGFYLPAMFHTDAPVKLVTGFEGLADSPLHWSLTKDDEAVSVYDYVTGELTAEGGMVQFKQPGGYTLEARFTDAGGRLYTCEQSFTVYPIPVISWTMPGYAHTDGAFPVAVQARNIFADTTVCWEIDDTYGLRQNWDTYVAGTLVSEPGEIRVKHAGVFTLCCEATDATGRVFYFDGPSIEVLAAQELYVSIIEDSAYTGETVQVRTLGNNIELPVEWYLERNGSKADLSACVTGELNNLGGAIQFTQAGSYRLIGTLTDGLGRAFTASDSITILPVGVLDFSVSAMEYEGHKVPVVMDKLIDPDGNTVIWSAQKGGAAYTMDLSGLDNDGGTVTFPEPGSYTLTATLRDNNGRTVTDSHEITIIFKPSPVVRAPESVHIGADFEVSISGVGSLDVEWIVKYGSRPVTLNSQTGFLSNDGGPLALFDEGTYTILATVRDAAGNIASASTSVTVTNTAPVLTSYTADSTRTMKNGRYYADLRAACSDPDGDEVHLEWSSEYQPDGYYEVGTHTIQVRVVDEWGAVSAWQTRTIEFINSAPAITSFTADVTRRVSGNAFFADVKATASDPDGDVVKLEWDGDYSSSGWYARGSEHTVRVRAVDEYGAASPWQERTFEFVNQAPSKPVITKTPSGGVVRPSETVTIKAASTDPEGDAITYEWDGRTAESAKYGYGKQLIKCRAVDAYGATSPWAAIVFFVADNNGGGMTLTSANSFIEEPGISFEADGETINGYITEYTYDVPAVSGHNGNDYGKIEAYNVLTHTWDQIAYQTTNNGVNLTGVLPTGTYTQMRFYYYTNHNCMYNKSNITYSIVFDF